MGDFHTQPANPELRHTATPWRVSTQKWYPWPYAVGIEGTQPANFEHDTICWTTTGGTENHEANAAFIVEAVNSHATLQARVDELTKALKVIAEDSYLDEYQMEFRPTSAALTARAALSLEDRK